MLRINSTVSKLKNLTKGLSGRLYSSNEQLQEKISYSATVNLPRTTFPNKLSATKLQEVERTVFESKFQQFYKFQKDLQNRDEYVLHDGPPYANGDLHMGHSVNKILKDITIRQKFMNGKLIDFIPGWDCHGLPIELKALVEASGASPIDIRTKCSEFAKNALEKQKVGFQTFGVAAAWQDGEGFIYKTNNPSYISNELELFYDFYQKGLVFRDLKPVFWSPSSRTALAESELEYDNNFKSPSVFLRLKLENITDTFAIIWTTTPWTLPSNQAICYNPSQKYALVNLDGDLSKKYLISTSLINNFAETTNKTVDIVETIDGNDLVSYKYHHPINSTILPFLPASHVEDTKGTGLVHTAPAHGPDDFLVSLSFKIPVLSLVDEEGKYTSEAPDFLVGKQVLEEGNKLVSEKLKDDLLFESTIIHSYPMDWRTKKPVIIRASEQWFMNTETLKAKACEEIEKIKIYPRVNAEANRNMMMNQVQKRPYWCISRQRSWGVPIPVFYNKNTQEVVLNSEILKRIINLLSEEKSMDFWWSMSPAEILTPEICSSLNVLPENLVKGNDIFDIWFDSGTSWSSVLGPDKIADLYLEGYDQFSGWFQSSLLTSIAKRNCAPYKSLFVHGFTVDDKGLKMSKSIGNVISPFDIIKKYGTDSLRWWVAAHGTQHMSIKVNDKLMQQSAESVLKIRSTLRYLNGVLGKEKTDTIFTTFDYSKTSLLDKFILNALSKYAKDVQSSYDSFEYNRATAQIQNFIVNEMSSIYLHLVKDRLYCSSDEDFSQIRSVLEQCYRVICRSIWPLTPFLVEESWSHFNPVAPFYKTETIVDSIWENKEAEEVVEEALSVKRKINQMERTNSWLFSCSIKSNSNQLQNLIKLQPTLNEFVSDSELCEILQVGSVQLLESNESSIDVIVKDTSLCPRCRRFQTPQEKLCERCLTVMKFKGF